MAKNLSVPICFVSLLHLANEKVSFEIFMCLLPHDRQGLSNSTCVAQAYLYLIGVLQLASSASDLEDSKPSINHQFRLVNISDLISEIGNTVLIKMCRGLDYYRGINWISKGRPMYSELLNKDQPFCPL